MKKESERIQIPLTNECHLRCSFCLNSKKEQTNIYKLSQEGKNLIVLPETVLDELDSKKSGFDEINFQAREFARILENSKILDSVKKDSYKIIRLKTKNKKKVLLRSV